MVISNFYTGWLEVWYGGGCGYWCLKLPMGTHIQDLMAWYGQFQLQVKYLNFLEFYTFVGCIVLPFNFILMENVVTSPPYTEEKPPTCWSQWRSGPCSSWWWSCSSPTSSWRSSSPRWTFSRNQSYLKPYVKAWNNGILVDPGCRQETYDDCGGDTTTLSRKVVVQRLLMIASWFEGKMDIWYMVTEIAGVLVFFMIHSHQL